MHPAHHTEHTFLVPRKDAPLDVGVHAATYVETLQDEVAELADSHAERIGHAEANPHALVAFGMAVAALAARQDDSLAPAALMAHIAGKYERILAWLSEAQDTVQMGLRTFAMLYTLRPDLTGGATLEAIGRQSRRTRAAVDKYVVEFRDTFGIKPPSAKSEHTRKRCKKAQLSRRR